MESMRTEELKISLLGNKIYINKNIELKLERLNCLDKNFKPLPCSNLLDNNFWNSKLIEIENMNFDDDDFKDVSDDIESLLISAIPSNFENLDIFDIEDLKFFSVQNNDTNRKEFNLSLIKLSDDFDINFLNCKMQFKHEPNKKFIIEGCLEEKIIIDELKRLIDELKDNSCKFKY